jgi:GTP cyclohydrolase I
MVARQVPAPAVGSLEVVDAEERHDWQRLHPRDLSEAQLDRFRGYLSEIFQSLGMPIDTPGTVRTPERYLRALIDATEGYEGDPKLVTAFPTECKGGADCRLSQTIEGPIPFHALCEHHAFPFFGHVYIGYIAHEHIIGISKMTRLVRLFARRFTLQERIGEQVASTLERVLQAHAVAVFIEGIHLCTQMRGVREGESVTHNTYWRGSYGDDPQLRTEFLSIVQSRQAAHRL